MKKLLLLFKLCLLGVLTQAQNSTDIIIHRNNYQGPSIDYFFLDVKNLVVQRRTEQSAIPNFEQDDMNGIRIPILGNLSKPAHPSSGQVLEEFYESTLITMENARKVRGEKPFYVFASKKLDAQNSFPSWVKNSNGVMVEEYTEMLVDFILFFESNGFEIDFLGIQNEEEYNEGNITPQKHRQIVEKLRNESVSRGFKMPKIVGYEGFGPGANGDWMKVMNENGWLNSMDIYGTHYYPHLRRKDKLISDLGYAGNMPYWSTEAHWQNSNKWGDEWTASYKSIVTLWDQIDLGMSGLTWWNYSRTGSLRGHLMRNFSVPLLGAKKILVNDEDGQSVENDGELHTRAFREGDTITLFIVNHTSENRMNRTVRLNSGFIKGTVKINRWIKSEDSVAPNQNTVDATNSSEFKIDIPQYSFASISFRVIDKIELPEGPAGYIYNSDKGEVIKSNIPLDIAFGADGEFNYLYNQRSDVTCGPQAFGDPIAGRTKNCFIKESKTSYWQNPFNIPGILNAELYDYGGKNVSFFDLTDINKGASESNFRVENGMDIGKYGDNRYIGWIGNGEWTEYTMNIKESGVYELEFHVASDNNNGRIGMLVDSQQVFTALAVPNTGSVENFSTVSVEVELEKGLVPVRINYEVGGFNFDKMVSREIIVTSIENKSETNTEIYPNPSMSGIFHLSSVSSWNLYSIQGKFLEKGTGDKIDLTDYTSGSYLLGTEKSRLRQIVIK